MLIQSIRLKALANKSFVFWHPRNPINPLGYQTLDDSPELSDFYDIITLYYVYQISKVYKWYSILK